MAGRARALGRSMTQAARHGGKQERYELMGHDVLYHSNHLIAVNKRAGIPSQLDSSGASDIGSYVTGFVKKQARKAGNVYVAPLHRLDRCASGCLLLARTSKAAKRMQRMFLEHKVYKEYLVVVQGNLEGAGKFEGGNSSYASYWEKRSMGGTNARADNKPRNRAPDGDLHWATLGSIFSVQSHATPDVYSLVAVRIASGRKHQVRRQLAGLGHPIVGDRLYGSHQRLEPVAPFKYEPIMLHASRLEFDNPVIPVAEDLAAEKKTRRGRTLGSTAPRLSAAPRIVINCDPPAFWRTSLRGLVFPDLPQGGKVGLFEHAAMLQSERGYAGGVTNDFLREAGLL